MSTQVERPVTPRKPLRFAGRTRDRVQHQTVAGRTSGPALLPADLRDGAGTQPARGLTPVGPLARCLLGAIDRYRARVAATCSLCRTHPEQSFSYRVRARVVERGAMAGLLMLASGWLVTHLGPRDKCGWRPGGIHGRFERGGW